MEKMDDAARRLARMTVDHALDRGADEVAVRVSRSRFVDLKQRAGRVETLQASTSRGLSVSLYADGRYSSNSTSLLEAAEVRCFVDETLAMTRALAPDAHRRLPDPELYGPAAAPDLELWDPGHDALSMDRRLELVAATEGAALPEGAPIISATAQLMSQAGQSLQLHSNGFEGEAAGTAFYLGAVVTASDDQGRRPEDHWYTGARHLADLPGAAGIGAEAARRALDRRGARKVPSASMTLLVENRVASRLVSSLLAPLTGAALQQRRSCLEGRLDQRVGSDLLTLVDEPLLPRGLGSRTYDGEGLAARGLTLFEEGRLRGQLVDTYYGRKLGVAPTTGSPSNLVLVPGEQDLAALEAGVQRGVLVTAFLGGNANPATGDFSFGVAGHLLRGGRRVHPVGEMNITGNHLELWRRLVAVGADPYPYATSRVPSLRFDDVQFSGS